MDKKAKTIIWLILIFFNLLFLPSVLKEGMFFDGLTYSSISRNLSISDGTIFELKYTETLGNPFYDHPPLFFIIQSFFFRIFGDYFFVEKVFCLFFLIFNSYLLYLIISKFVKYCQGENAKAFGLTSILITFIVPIYLWAFKNNMLEILISTFSLLSFLTFYSGTESQSKDYLYLFPLSILFILFAVLVKGTVGLFPLVYPLAFLIIIKSSSFKLKPYLYKVIFYYLAFFLVVFLGWFVLQNSNVISYYYNEYINNQLFKSLLGNREVTGSRFQVVFAIFKNLILPILFFGVMYFIFRKHSNQKEKRFKNVSYLLLIIAISASFPIMISPKQRDFYIMPSIPFYVGFLCFYFYEEIQSIFSSNSFLRISNGVKRFALISFVVPIIYLFSPFGRDQSIISDIHKLKEEGIQNITFLVTKHDFENWKMVAYFQRYLRISLTDKKNNSYHYDIQFIETSTGEYQTFNINKSHDEK